MLLKTLFPFTQIGNPVVSTWEKVVNPILSLSDFQRDIEIVSPQELDLPSNKGIKIIFQSANFANISQYIELAKFAREPITLLVSRICTMSNMAEERGEMSTNMFFVCSALPPPHFYLTTERQKTNYETNKFTLF